MRLHEHLRVGGVEVEAALEHLGEEKPQQLLWQGCCTCGCLCVEQCMKRKDGDRWLSHRIVESFVLERTLKGCLVQLPCNEQGHIQLDQGAHSPVLFN